MNLPRRAVAKNSPAITTVSSSGGRLSVMPPITTGIRFAAANAVTPPCRAPVTSSPDAGVTAQSTSASPAVNSRPEPATVAPRTAAAAATRPVARPSLGVRPVAAGRSGANWRITPPLSHDHAPVHRQARRCAPDRPLDQGVQPTLTLDARSVLLAGSGWLTTVVALRIAVAGWGCIGRITGGLVHIPHRRGGR